MPYYYFVIFGVAIMIFCVFSIYVGRAYPEVEFNFGPEHQNRAKKKKSSLNWLASTILIPIILMIFENFFKK